MPMIFSRAMFLAWILCMCACICVLAVPRAYSGFFTTDSTGVTTFVHAEPTSCTPGPGLRARQVNPAQVVDILVSVVKFVDQTITILNNDKNARMNYTQSLVTGVRERYPYFNVVVCHGIHTPKWDGVEGRDWLHQHKEFDIKAGGTVGYDVYIARSGLFQNQGDGGYLNWAYGGNIMNISTDKASVTFGPYAIPRGKFRT